MVGRLTLRQTWLVAIILLAALFTALPAAAQGSNGMAQGVVKDTKGEPVAGATITFQSTSSTRKVETKTNNKGEFFQIGLAPGNYTITATKGDLASVPQPARIVPDDTLKTELVVADKKAVAAASTATNAAAKAEAARVEAVKAEFAGTFNDGVAASGAGKFDEAIAKFDKAIELNPQCNDCYTNLGYAQAQKKDYEKAEAAYKKAIEIKPTDTAYNGLVGVYTAQKKFDLANEMSAKATALAGAAGGAAGGNPDAMYNQGVTLWNSGKIDEAKKQFEAVIKANPNHAEAHFQLGMALVNEGNLAGAAGEFETYLKLAPSGPNAATAKSLVSELKK